MLHERFAAHAARQPEATALVILRDGETESERITFGELDARARAGARRLAGAALGGEVVLLPAEASVAFAVAFLACLYAGVVATPFPPASRGRGQERLLAIVAASRARAVIGGDVEGLPSLDIAAEGPESEPQAPKSDDVAFLQFTSGSTSHPKGVVIRHRALFSNLAMITEAFGMTPDSRVLSWLPTFHDMGLICLLMPLYGGFVCYLAPPLSFLHRPLRWLRAIDRHGVTISGGPNFAYDLCSRRLRAEGSGDIDLSRWKVAFCGAEPVRADTMLGFAEAAGAANFDAGALYPCYGMAEATLYVSGGPRGRGARLLERNGRRLVSSGVPAEGSLVRIVGDDARPLADGEEGEIWLAGPHLASGYRGAPPDADLRFGARLPEETESFFRTGDLGFIDAGELVVSGRLSDIVIHRGVNHHPEDIEAAVLASWSGWERAGAAFGIESDGAEAVVLVQEAPRAIGRDLGELTQLAIEAVAAAEGLVLADFVIVRAGALPRTTSGKVKRAAVRTLYEAGELSPLTVS